MFTADPGTQSEFSRHITDYYDDTIKIIGLAVAQLDTQCQPGGSAVECDPVDGANTRMGPNGPVQGFKQIVANYSTEPTQAEIQEAYDLYFQQVYQDQANPGGDPHFYIPDWPAIIQPILLEEYQLDGAGNYSLKAYSWIGSVYHLTNNGNTFNNPRYPFETTGG